MLLLCLLLLLKPMIGRLHDTRSVLLLHWGLIGENVIRRNLVLILTFCVDGLSLRRRRIGIAV